MVLVQAEWKKSISIRCKQGVFTDIIGTTLIARISFNAVMIQSWYSAIPETVKMIVVKGEK